jgi:aspartokinase
MFAAGHATESFSDFVVGHGELWSAQMLSYAIKKVKMKSACKLFMTSTGY